MVITYHGGQCFKVTFAGTTIAFNPIAKKSKLESVKFGADVTLVSAWHPDFNGINQVTHGSKKPFVIDGPGEYEVGQVVARGYGISTIYDKRELINTIYQVHLEGVNIVFMGALNTLEIDSKILGEFGDIDILFIPIGGGDVLEAPQASKLGVKLEAKLVIPMHYDENALSAFLKEEGKEGLEAVGKITLKPKDVQEMSGDVVILKS